MVKLTNSIIASQRPQFSATPCGEAVESLVERGRSIAPLAISPNIKLYASPYEIEVYKMRRHRPRAREKRGRRSWRGSCQFKRIQTLSGS